MGQSEQANSLLQERNYYLQKRNELLELHDQFSKIKTDLLKLAQLFHPGGKEFTNKFFNFNIAAMDCANPSVEQELQLSVAKKIELRQLREVALDCLEKQMEELHIAIGVHFNELKLQHTEAFEVCQSEIVKLSGLIDHWNETNSQQIGIEAYNSTLSAEHLLENLTEKVDELKLTLNYYKSSNNAEIFRQTSSIEDMFEFEKTLQDFDKNGISQNRSVIRQNKLHLEGWLRDRGISTHHLKENINTTLRNQKNKKHSEAIRNAEQKKSSSQFPKPPKKDDKER